MSSTTGLSSNTSNNQPRNALQLDAAARDSILARNQARVLSALGVTTKDEFNSGGGLNPLKGLYSAAAATFLKNKQSQQGAEQAKGAGSYEKAADILKQLAGKSNSTSGSSGSGSTFSSNVSGPASGGNYKKYQWTGNPGPTGSEVVKEAPVEAPVAETKPADPVDLSSVYNAFVGTVTDGGGGTADRGDGAIDFKVLDIVGTIGQKGDKLVGSVTADSGTYSFEIAANGAVVLDASKGNTTSAEFDQLKHLLSGSLDGSKRKTVAPPPADPTPPPASSTPPADPTPPPASSTPPADPTPPPVGQTPEEKAAADKAAADKAAADKAAADKAAADKAAADKAAADKAAADKAAADKAPLNDTFSDLLAIKGPMSQQQGGDVIDRLGKYLTAAKETGTAVDLKRVGDVVNALAKYGPSDNVVAKASSYADKFNKGDGASVKMDGMMVDLKKSLADGATHLVDGSVLTSSTTSLALATASGTDQDLGRYNAKLLFNDIQSAGGAVALASDGKSFLISLNGQSGTMQIESGRLKGKLGTGDGEISFEIKQNGVTNIDGKDSNATAKANSLNLRKAIGASTSVGTDFDARVVKFNRYGTGTGLNLLG